MDDDTILLLGVLFMMGVVGAAIVLAVVQTLRPYNTVLSVERDEHGRIVSVVERRVPA